MMDGLAFAFNLIKEFSNAQIDFMQAYKNQFGIPEVKSFYNLPDETLFGKVSEFLTDKKLESLYGLGKKDFGTELENLETQTKEFL